MKKEALLLIDIQDVYFVPGDYFLHNPKQAAHKAKQVLDQFRAENKTVIHVKHAFKQFSDINKIVEPIPGEMIVEKKYPSSFLETNLQEYLVANGIEKLVVVGMMSHMCIDTTVRACQNYGYEVEVIADACTTKDLTFNGTIISAETVHNSYMAGLNKMFAKVMTLEEYFASK